jgi:hypothetical protein
MDPELAGPRAGCRDARAAERLGAVVQRLRVTQDVPLLGQRHELGTIAGRRSNQALGDLEVPARVGR